MNLELPASAKFITFPDIDKLDFWQPSRTPEIRIDPADAAITFSPEEDRAWAEMCTTNPRLHDGAILAVADVDPASHTIRCRLDRFRRLAVYAAKGIGEPVYVLGVKGWITAKDHKGQDEHVLIARRGSQTRVYPGLWESAPAGGVSVPPAGATALTSRDLFASLAIEAEEELGLTLPGTDAPVIAVGRDRFACSYDVFLALSLPDSIDPRHTPRCVQSCAAWEYSDAAWLARTDAATFDARTPSCIVPPVRAVLRSWANVKQAM